MPRTLLPRPVLVLAALSLSLFAFAPQAEAKYRMPSHAEVFGTSDLILVGKVSKIEARTYTLQVEQVVDGTCKLKEVQVYRRPRGRICAPQDPVFEQGSSLMVCLNKTKSGVFRSQIGTPYLIKKGRVVNYAFAKRHPKTGKVLQFEALKPFAATVKAFRACYRFSGQGWKTKAAPKVGPAKIRAFAASSPMAKLLVADAELHAKTKG